MLWSSGGPIVLGYPKADAVQEYDREMKTLLCILLLSAAAFGQAPDTEMQSRREKSGSKKIQLDRDVSGILLKANGGTGVNASHAFVQTGVDIDTSFQVTALHLAMPLGVSQGGTGASSFPGVLLAPSTDQTIVGNHSLIFDGSDFQIQLNPGPGLVPFIVHSPFANGIDLYTHADAGFRAPYINFYKSRGTKGAPTPVTFTGYELDSIGGINFGGWDGEKYFNGSAAIYTQSDENWTPTSHGGHVSIYGTSVNGGNTKQIAQFGGRGPNGELNSNVIFYRGLAFGGAQGGNPSLIPTSNPPTFHVRKADGSGDAALTAGSLTVTTPHTPATAFDACVAGTIAWDPNFVYVCVAHNLWKRSPLAAW
jgi:hypothetical protein